MKTLWFTWIKEGIGPTHRGILGTYTTNSTSKITQARRQSMVEKAENTIYQRQYVSREERTKFWMWRKLPDNNPTKDSTVLNGSDLSISTQSEEGKNANALDYRNIWIIRCLMQRNYDFQIRRSEADTLIKRQVSWIDIDRQSIKDWFAENQLMSGVTSDSKVIYKDQLMIACIHAPIQSTESK